MEYRCKLCDRTYSYNMAYNYRYCPTCWAQYRKFCQNIPDEWRAMMQCDADEPKYEEWEKEMLIKKRYFNQEITSAQKDAETRKLEAEIRKNHQTDGQPITSPKREPTFWDMPTIFKS